MRLRRFHAVCFLGKGRILMGELSIATFNAENFYMLLDRPYSAEAFFALSDDEYLAMNASIFNPNKDRSKIAAIARTIIEEDFDFVGLCEVGGMETLANFNRYYLDDRYECFLHEENSTRGIFVGALVKKGRFTQARAKNMRGDFSRNMLRVSLRADGVELDFFVVHLKSPLGPDLGIERRVEEVRQLCKIVGRSKCVVLGDFNGIVIRGEHQFEFEPFLALPFRDVLEQLGIPAESRYTHFYFGDGPSFNQLDYIFCSNDLAILGGGAIADIIPLNYEQRSRLPSDHLFLKALIGLG
jgi:endonuclease/exonuclease/phosphatase family metal-dependent hydrolase